MITGVVVEAVVPGWDRLTREAPHLAFDVVVAELRGADEGPGPIGGYAHSAKLRKHLSKRTAPQQCTMEIDEPTVEIVNVVDGGALLLLKASMAAVDIMLTRIGRITKTIVML